MPTIFFVKIVPKEKYKTKRKLAILQALFVTVSSLASLGYQIYNLIESDIPSCAHVQTIVTWLNCINMLLMYFIFVFLGFYVDIIDLFDLLNSFFNILAQRKLVLNKIKAVGCELFNSIRMQK